MIMEANDDNFINSQNLIHLISTPILVTDKNGVILIWNKALEEFSGIKSSEIVGKSDLSKKTDSLSGHRTFLIQRILKKKKKRYKKDMNRYKQMNKLHIKKKFFYQILKMEKRF